MILVRPNRAAGPWLHGRLQPRSRTGAARSAGSHHRPQRAGIVAHGSVGPRWLLSPSAGRYGVAVPPCAKPCHVVTEPIAHWIAHTRRADPRSRRNRGFPPELAGEEWWAVQDSNPLRRKGQVVPRCARKRPSLSHARACGVLGALGCARSCLAVSGCDRSRCTLDCTLGRQGNATSLRDGWPRSSTCAAVAGQCDANA